MAGGPLDWSRSGVGHIRESMQTPKHPHVQIVVHLDLARQPHVFGPIVDSLQPGSFWIGHRSRIPIEHLDPARSASRIPPAPMQDIDSRILDRQHEPPSRLRLDRSWFSLHNDKRHRLPPCPASYPKALGNPSRAISATPVYFDAKDPRA